MQEDRNAAAKRAYGTGLLVIKHDAYYGRWRAPGGRRLSRKIGDLRSPTRPDGITRPQAEKRFREIQAREASDPRRPARIVRRRR